MVATAYALWRALVRWRVAWCLAAGGALGLALATKYSALLLLPVIPFLAVGRALDHPGRPAGPWTGCSGLARDAWLPPPRW